MKKNKDSEYRRVKILSDYSGFDFFLIKKPLQCTVRIPDTVLLDKYGAPRDWIFNSGKLPHHPILKKRKQNLLPLNITKNICSKFVPFPILAPIKSIAELKDVVKSNLMEKKDADFVNKKKHLEIRTMDGQFLQISLLDFLEYIGENKLAEQSFYEKWRMIQERVSLSKLDQSYMVQSIRKNHLIQSKSSKYIAVSVGNKVNAGMGGDDAFQQSLPSKDLEVTDTRVMQGYKFFDTYLNKKFFSAVQQIIECIEKNYKCIVESITSRFVIDQNREPHLAGIQDIYVKPALKLFQMRQFTQSTTNGEIKLDNYTRCLQQYIMENPVKAQPNLHQPLHEQRGHKCRGEFCLAIIYANHNPEPRIKLPLIGAHNIRKISLSLIENVHKRKLRVIQKMKENGVINADYTFQNDDSSEFEDSDLDQTDRNVKVCEICYNFYLNVQKYFQIDGFGNLVDKKPPSSARTRTRIEQTERKGEKQLLEEESNEKMLGNQRRKDIKSLKNLHQRRKSVGEQIAEPVVKRSASQHAKLRPIKQVQNSKVSLKTQQKLVKPKIEKADLPEKVKKSDRSEEKKKDKVEQKTSKMIEAKLNNAKSKEAEFSKPNSLLKTASKKVITTKPVNFHQAAQQLLNKLESLPNSSDEQFIASCKKYYQDNLPQQVDRWHFSTDYLQHMYDFMNNSPLGIAPGNRIKKRPEMSLKRLSEITNYPEIVSRSTFIFDTLICDEKTTVPFCVISSKMIHNNNQPGKAYQNVFVVNDIFDSYIQYISMAKQLLEEARNTRVILFNYPGQSHTIYEKGGVFRSAEFCSILDKIIYRLSSETGQLNIIAPNDKLKFIGFGFGGYLLSSFLASNPALNPITTGVLLINTAPYCTTKYKSIFTSLSQVYVLQDKPTEDNAFLYYNKAINSIELEKEDMESKAGLNSIRLDGRVYLLRNALQFWDQGTTYNFVEFNCKVDLLYSRANILLTKSDMQRYLFKPDVDHTNIPNRTFIQIEGGHDTIAENYTDLFKYVEKFII